MKTGNTRSIFNDIKINLVPQWSPVMKTGNTSTCNALFDT